VDLNALREEIDKIDDQLIELYCRRMEIVAKVADYKIANKLPVYHAEREKAIIQKVREKAGKQYADGAAELFQTMMDISKNSQNEKMAERSELYNKILSAEKKVDLKAISTVACQGVKGAYSYEAAKKMFAQPQISYYDSFLEVFQAVESGECEYGILPIENSSAGSVLAVYDLMKRFNFYICKSLRLSVSHKLLACGNASFETITDVYSHSQALSQCSDFFENNKQIKSHIFSNTAMAAKYVSELCDSTKAAIASEECASLYNLKIIKSDFQNSNLNYTRFICISKKLKISDDANKISLSLRLPNVAGSLYRFIQQFALHNLNLIKLESRPVPETNFEFMFYFDFEGHVAEKRILSLLCALHNQLEYFEFLGNYNEIE